MKRGYSGVRGTFWNGSTGLAVRALEPRSHAKDVRILMAYLATGPHAEPTGLYFVEPTIVCLETGLEPAEVHVALTTLHHLDYCQSDGGRGWIWVKEMAAHQFGAPLNPKDFNCLNLRRWYRTVPRNPFLGAWWDRYHADFHLELDPDAAPRRDGAPMPPASPLEAPPNAPSKGRSRSDQIRSSVQVQVPVPDDGFLEFWAAYPRKEKKQQAHVTWRKLKPTPEDRAAIMARLEKRNWPTYWLKEFPDHVPHPSTWLNDRRWEDEHSTTTLTARSLRTARVLDNFIGGTDDGPTESTGSEETQPGVRRALPRLGTGS